MQTRELNNAVQIPLLGLGTFKVANSASCVNAVRDAINMGYRLIDTAAIYKNEEAVGRGIGASGIERKDIFVTSKVWNDEQGFDSTLRACETSLKKLGLDYLDLYLVHWPGSVNLDTWKAMERLYQEKRVRAIGVSNFKIHHLDKLLAAANVVPAVNQTELHPCYAQRELDAYCRQRGIVLQGWGPLMQGKIFEIPLMIEIAQAYGKTVSQIALRWALQKGFLCIPKSTKSERMAENAAIFDWAISELDMERLAGLESGQKVGMDPDQVLF